MSSEKVLPLNLEEIVGDFELCEGREKLELLLDFARSFPDFPDHSNPALSCPDYEARRHRAWP